MIKVSVVIPVYNVEKYLAECIDSVINQTLKDIEIICVDDGSTDSCPGILDGYAEKDSRIKVIHVPNGGYGKAMNIGFEAAAGEYIGIAESDDIALPDMYETLYKNAADNNMPDIVKSDYLFYWSVGNVTLNSHQKKYEQFYNKILKHSDKEAMFLFAPSNWSGIYKKEFIVKNDIKHHETPGASYQDLGFWFQVSSLAESALIIDRAFYMYRQDNPASSMKRKDKMMSVINECDWSLDLLRAKGAENRFLNLCTLFRLVDHKSTFKRIDDSLKPEYARIIRNDYLDRKDMVSELLSPEHNRKDFEWLEAVADDPEKVCGEYISEKNKTLRFFSSADKLVIYGAGRRALMVCSALYNNGFYDKILCAAVTEKPLSDTFFGKPLICINELRETDPVILVSVKKESEIFAEIKENLDSLGYKNVYDTENIAYL